MPQPLHPTQREQPCHSHSSDRTRRSLHQASLGRTLFTLPLRLQGEASQAQHEPHETARAERHQNSAATPSVPARCIGMTRCAGRRDRTDSDLTSHDLDPDRTSTSLSTRRPAVPVSAVSRALCRQRPGASAPPERSGRDHARSNRSVSIRAALSPITVRRRAQRPQLKPASGVACWRDSDRIPPTSSGVGSRSSRHASAMAGLICLKFSCYFLAPLVGRLQLEGHAPRVHTEVWNCV